MPEWKLEARRGARRLRRLARAVAWVIVWTALGLPAGIIFELALLIFDEADAL